MGAAIAENAKIQFVILSSTSGGARGRLLLISQAIHTLDLMLSLTGPMNEVTAMAATTGFHQMEAEDFVAVIGLLRLWYMIRKTPTGVPDLEARLSTVKQAVSHAMSTHLALDIFRLGLLESAIQMLLDSPDKGTMEVD